MRIKRIRRIVVGKARFTVIAPECIRIEYAKDGKFVDAKSMFAVGRDAVWRGFQLSHDGSNVVIDTGRSGCDTGLTASRSTRRICTPKSRGGKDWVEWWPGEQNQGTSAGRFARWIA
jgi:hypothetical protein